jgi:D-tyrosyl-tRNA(Tyr) deacylase
MGQMSFPDKLLTMIAVIQRVTSASVTFNKTTRSINKGYMVLLGIDQNDTQDTATKVANKLIGLRIMADENSKMNLSLKDAKGELLIVSQFTLIADASQGSRPSFIKAAKAEVAKPLFDQVVKLCLDAEISTQTGFFGEYMKVELINDGPTTIVLDSHKL